MLLPTILIFMWTYRSSTGELVSYDGTTVGVGYSGAGPGKNNPAMDNVRDVGPIPRGQYAIGAPVNTVTHGPYVLPLTPDPKNEMHGRFSFLVHGDSLIEPGTASKGCLILARNLRERIWDSGDHTLSVVA